MTTLSDAPTGPVLPRWRIALWGTIAALLLLPLAAMQVTREVAWDATDFAAAAILLIGGGLLFELAVRFVPDRRRRVLIAATILAAVVVIWAQGAVGIF